jgi:hypothetical protein
LGRIPYANIYFALHDEELREALVPRLRQLLPFSFPHKSHAARDPFFGRADTEPCRPAPCVRAFFWPGMPEYLSIALLSALFRP